MSTIGNEIVFLLLQFLQEEKYGEALHKLEKEAGVFFNMKYFDELITSGKWEEAELYLSGFTKIEDNRYSMKMYFEIRKQKYLEALDKHDHGKAVEILARELKVFSAYNGDLIGDMTMLLTLPNFRENEQLSRYTDSKSARRVIAFEMQQLIKENPAFHDKLEFPIFRSSRLRTMINQSLNWQHHLCESPKFYPDIKTLLVDHNCGHPTGAPLPSGRPLRIGGYMPLGVPSLFQHAPTPAPAPAPPTALRGGWNPSSVLHQAVPTWHLGLTPPRNDEVEPVSKRLRPFFPEIRTCPVHIGSSYAESSYNGDIPKTVVANLNEGSVVTTMHFHPDKGTLLLVGTNTGDISLWEVGRQQRLALRIFQIWDVDVCTLTLRASLEKEFAASANRVKWSPDGSLFGVAYSKHIVHLYTYRGRDDLSNHLEIDAHVGSVNDLAFSCPSKKLYVITCGDDKAIKVWDAATGDRLFNYEGHNAPVYSVYPHYKDDIPFIFSTDAHGKIKAWLYDGMGSRIQYDAPGHSYTTLAYSSDGKRLFSCGTSENGEPYIVEWDETEGSLKRTYHGLGKRCFGVVKFDTKNRFLVAGDEFAIKFWDMDSENLLCVTDADGDLPASPCIRFNKEGTLLAVSTSKNGFKILANSEGIQLLSSMENHASASLKASMISTFGAYSSAAGTSTAAERNGPVSGFAAQNDNHLLELSLSLDGMETSRTWKLTEINEPSQLRSLKIPDSLLPVRIMRLVYTHSGRGIVALAYNAIHKIWKWPRNGRNSVKATTAFPPQLWQPANGILMTNNISHTNLEEAVPCFAISLNDFYVVSASGGTVSLFNVISFKTMVTFNTPPPAATALAFHPRDNNIVAIGLEDASIKVYQIRDDHILSTIRGHSNRVTGLAFSKLLGILVSSGADCQIHAWCMEGWKQMGSTSLEMPFGRIPNPHAQTRVQFHMNQMCVLAVHETQIGIYGGMRLQCFKKWFPGESSAKITDATFSCDGRSVYTAFEDGSVSVFTTAGLKMKCRISLNAYVPSGPSSRVYPVAIAAHPSEPNQFALGLTNGAVHVLEPLETERRWGTTPPQDNGAGPSMRVTVSAAAFDYA